MLPGFFSIVCFVLEAGNSIDRSAENVCLGTIAALTGRRRGSFREGDESSLWFRCLPTDIDPNLHLNNAHYMMLADMGRLDIFF